MTGKTPDQLLGEMADLQNQIGNEMVRLLEENTIDWDQTRLHVEHLGKDHHQWSLRYRKADQEIAGIFVNDALQTLTAQYVERSSEAANDQVKRVRFHLTSDMNFNVEMWYTPTEGLPGWTWEEEETDETSN